MRTFSKILVERNKELWFAWFRDVPQIVMQGAWPTDAIRELLWHFGEEQFETEQIVSVDDGFREDYREFMIPLRHQRRIPIPLTIDLPFASDPLPQLFSECGGP